LFHFNHERRQILIIYCLSQHPGLPLKEIQNTREGVPQEDGVVPDELSGGIDLMGNSSGKLANRFELLGLAKLNFQL
jgi:hypothetical protein